MSVEQEVEHSFAAAKPYAEIEAFAASSCEIAEGAHRLEGLYYGQSGYRAKKQLEHSGFPVVPVCNLADVFWPGIFRRIYVGDLNNGTSFLSTSEMMLAKIDAKNLVSQQLTSNLEEITPVDGTILVSRSGTIGNVTIVTEDFAGCAVSEDALRVNPKNDDERGLIYAFLQSQAGQFLMTRNKSGGVVEHIYEEDLNSLRVPLLPRHLRRELSDLIDKSSNKRVTANQLIDEAIADVQHQCYLPDMSHFMPGRTSTGEPLSYIHSAKARLFPENAPFGECRLDATYHEPAAVAVAKYILSQDRGCRLGEVLTAVRNSTLRKRNYVDDPEFGVALIGGKQLMQWRPQGVKYLSKALTRNLENETVQDGWTLVSCGGTLGRTMYVHRNFDGCAGSQHIMRLVPDTASVFGGFIYAFLASPYGQVQIAQRSYGSVIQEIRDFQFKSIAISLPDDRGELIHEKVVRAFDCRADAHDLEDRALSLFETAIERGRAYTEAEWGSEY